MSVTDAFAVLRDRFPDKTEEEIRAALATAAAQKAKQPAKKGKAKACNSTQPGRESSMTMSNTDSSPRAHAHAHVHAHAHAHVHANVQHAHVHVHAVGTDNCTIDIHEGGTSELASHAKCIPAPCNAHEGPVLPLGAQPFASCSLAPSASPIHTPTAISVPTPGRMSKEEKRRRRRAQAEAEMIAKREERALRRAEAEAPTAIVAPSAATSGRVAELQNGIPDSSNLHAASDVGRVHTRRTLNINVGVLGHVDSGKTSLTRALSTISSTGKYPPYAPTYRQALVIFACAVFTT